MEAHVDYKDGFDDCAIFVLDACTRHPFLKEHQGAVDEVVAEAHARRKAGDPVYTVMRTSPVP